MRRIAKLGGRKVHRTVGESSARRATKKLTEKEKRTKRRTKSEWFRKA